MRASPLGYLTVQSTPVPMRGTHRTINVLRPYATRLAKVRRSMGARLGRTRKSSSPFVQLRSGLYFGAAPRTAAHASELTALRVTAVVCLLQEHEPRLDPRAFGAVHVLALPTPDYTSPTEKQIREAVDFVSRHRAAGNVVLIHCRAGRGRSAVCSVAYLCTIEGLSVREAHREVRKCRRSISSLHGPQWRTLTAMMHRADA